MNTTRFRVNGHAVTVSAEAGATLLSALRTQLALTGTKYGCGESLCGACTVLVDGHAVQSCITPLERMNGREVTTVEGLAHADTPSPLQQAFIDHGALQCGYCTPGMLMTATALLRENPKPTRDQVAARLEHHLCRCGAHQRILDAVEDAAVRMKGKP